MHIFKLQHFWKRVHYYIFTNKLNQRKKEKKRKKDDDKSYYTYNCN